MIITIDKTAGFCPGVKRSVGKAEKNLHKGRDLYSLGSLLHNELEMDRLEECGLKQAGSEDIPGLSGKKLLFRTHGEPPATYALTRKHGVEVVDATCGVVRRLQKLVERAAREMEKHQGRVIIFGKPEHPEVIGLMGHTKGLGLVVKGVEDLGVIDLSVPLRLFSQTTMDEEKYREIKDLLIKMAAEHGNKDFVSYDTICRHVLNRGPLLKTFAVAHEVVVFVSGQESSNGKKLFSLCLEANPSSYFITGPEELDPTWFGATKSVGISGAASTPQWLMESVAKKIEEFA